MAIKEHIARTYIIEETRPPLKYSQILNGKRGGSRKPSNKWIRVIEAV
ncbi:hypothetical protein J31TS6_33050 [Brevibacillus reuszeri]|nr:hypothetical protein J31TS6_33050 [Brevibacillus reuszeri]